MAKIAFTAGRVSGFKCPPDKKQAFLWDATAPGLGLRATPAGKPAYVFQSVYQGKDLRITIGSPAAWSIPDAQAKARELQRLIDEGKDPRDLKRDALAATKAQAAALEAAALEAAAQAVTVGEAWAAYCEARRPHWGALHLRDHIGMMAPGGEPKKRGKGLTTPGPLHHFAALRLADVSAEAVQAWAAQEAKERPTRARLALSLFHAFLNWCSEQPQFADLVADKNPAHSRRAREVLPKPKAKTDALMKEQLPAWFTAVRAISNPSIAALVQVLLLTGARLNEILALRWDDIDTQWRSLTVRDKDESKGGRDGFRVIPLTPYVWHLLAALPRRGSYVFAGASGDAPLHKPNLAHTKACAVAGLDGLTLHGLRRSFGTLPEWLELPAGVIAQIQGHKPSATAEKHYRVRPLDLLRVHHERLEAWILEQAGIVFDAQAEPGKLRVVGAA
ncbi:MAG: tyrosine-type recombinase/integrase [Gammaproteobacteria bacterium]